MRRRYACNSSDCKHTFSTREEVHEFPKGPTPAPVEEPVVEKPTPTPLFKKGAPPKDDHPWSKKENRKPPTFVAPRDPSDQAEEAAEAENYVDPRTIDAQERAAARTRARHLIEDRAFARENDLPDPLRTDVDTMLMTGI
jgi:hypothetical protein